MAVDGFSDPIIGGGGVLVREAITSTNYPGPSSWALLADGSAFMSGATIAGDIESSNYVPGSDGYHLDYDTGSAEFNDITARGTIDGATIDGATINGGTIVGTTLKTANTGPRIEIGSTGLSFIHISHGHASELAKAYVTAQRITSPSPGGVLVLSAPDQGPGAPPAIAITHYDSGAKDINLISDAVKASGQIVSESYIQAVGFLYGSNVQTSANAIIGGAASVGSTLTVGGAVTFPYWTPDYSSSLGDGTYTAGTWYTLSAPLNWSVYDEGRVWLAAIKIRDNGTGSPERISTGAALISPAFWNAQSGGRGIVEMPIDRHNNATPLRLDISAAPGANPRALQFRPSVTFTTSGGGGVELKLKRMM